MIRRFEETQLQDDRRSATRNTADIQAVHAWLVEEERRGVHGNFSCNWMDNRRARIRMVSCSCTLTATALCQLGFSSAVWFTLGFSRFATTTEVRALAENWLITV